MSGGVGGERSRRLDAICALLLLVAGTSLCMHVFASGKWGPRPNTQDESVYLFQAKTLASGHLTMPSPPLPEFFQAAHLLTVPRFAAKYLPGHAALLAPFEALGMVWLAPCLLLGATAALLFLAARLAGLSLWASWVAALLLLGNTEVFPFFASYLSQASSVAVIALALAVDLRPRPGRIAALFAAIAFTGLVRPFAGAAALATGAVVILRIRRRTPPLTLAWALPPLIAGALALGVVCKASTGSWTTAPWSLYAKQYMPFDGPGIGPVRSDAPTLSLPPHLRDLEVGFRQSRERHTFARLPGEAFRRLLLVGNLLPGWVAVAFAVAGLLWRPLWPAGVFAAAFFLLQLTFHFRAPIYYLETVPWLCLAAAAGAELAVRFVRGLRLAAALPAAAALVLAALWVGVLMGTGVRLVVVHAKERHWTYALWEPAFEWLREQRALVFLRYPAKWDGNIDLTYNEPDLSRASLVRAIDLGARDGELLPFFPGRPAFVLDVVTLRAERIR